MRTLTSCCSTCCWRRSAGWIGATDPALVVRYYELHLLALAGYQPQLFRCVQCSELLQAGDQLPEPGARRRVCARSTAPTSRTRWCLPLPVLKVLRFLQIARLGAGRRRLQLSPEVSRQVEAVLDAYIVYHLERRRCARRVFLLAEADAEAAQARAVRAIASAIVAMRSDADP